VIRAVIAAASEAETGFARINVREAISMRYTLEELDYKQPPTPIQVENSTA